MESANMNCTTEPAQDLAPTRLLQRESKPFGALFSESNLEFYEPRDREFWWSDPELALPVLEAHGNKVVVGLENGEIKIFSSVDLQCEKVLSHSRLKSKVTCVQCTEIIAGYDDASVGIWNPDSGYLSQRFCVANRAKDSYSILLRAKETRLVVVTWDGIVGIWSRENSTVKFVSEWKYSGGKIKRLEIHGDNIALHDSNDTLNVHNLRFVLTMSVLYSAPALHKVREIATSPMKNTCTCCHGSILLRFTYLNAKETPWLWQQMKLFVLH